MAVVKEKKHGGGGRNQGRKFEYFEETTTTGFRWPVSFIEDLNDIYEKGDRTKGIYDILVEHFGPKLKRTQKILKNAGKANK